MSRSGAAQTVQRQLLYSLELTDILVSLFPISCCQNKQLFMQIQSAPHFHAMRTHNSFLGIIKPNKQQLTADAHITAETRRNVLVSGVQAI
jgi:hypothetical protein